MDGRAFRSATARILTVVLAVLTSEAHAQTYPQRPVKLVVPFAAGGTTDAVGRILAHSLGERLGQQVMIENRGDEGGTIGSEAAARSTADGYTLLLASAETFGLTYADAKRLNYDPDKDLVPVAMVARAPNVFVVNPAVKATTMRELIDLTRATPGKLRYGSPGIGTNVHIIGEMLKSRLELDLQDVPYQLDGEAVLD